MKRFKGFSLIEMILSIGIILILLSIVTINFNIKDKIEAREQIKTMALDIKFLKNYAQINNTRTSMDISDNSYTMKFGEKSKEVKFNQLVKLEESNLNNITFTSKGKPSYIRDKSSAGTLIYSVGKKKFRISIQPVTGKVNISEYEK